MLRLTVRLVFLALAALTGYVIYLIFFPWSLAALDHRIKSGWEEATGLRLDFARARIHVLGGYVEIHEPMVYDPQSNEPLAELQRVRVEAPLSQFLFGSPPYVIKNIDVIGALSVNLTRRQGEWVLGAPWDRVLTVVREHRARRPQRQEASKVALQRLHLGKLSLDYAQVDAQGQRQVLGALFDATVDTEFQGSTQLQRVVVVGQLNGRDEAHEVRLALQPDLKRQLVRFNLRRNQFDSMDDLAGLLAGLRTVAFHGSGVDLVGQVARREGGRWELQAQSMIEQIQLIGTDSLPGQELGPTRLLCALTFDAPGHRLDVTRLSVESKAATLATSGTLATAVPYAYELNVNPLHLHGPILAVLAGALGRAEALVRPAEASLQLEGQLRGTLQARRPELAEGRLRLAGLNLQDEALPPLSNLQLDAHLTSQTLQIEQARGIVQGIPVEFSGQIRGQPLAGKIDNLDIAWKSSATLKELTTLINEQTSHGQESAMALSGQIAGQGRVRLTNPTEGKLKAILERMKVEGNLSLRDVQIAHPRLPAPIKKLNGQVKFSSKLVEFQDWSGEFLGNRVTLSGEARGQTIFWDKPRLSATAQSSLKLEDLLEQVQSLAPRLKPRLKALPALSGQADLSLKMTAEAGQLAKAQYEANVTLKDVATEITETDFWNGPLTLREARLKLDPSHLMVERATGRYGQTQFTLAARLRTDGGTLDLTSEGPLVDINRHIPPNIRIFRTGGAARSEGHFELAARSSFTPPATWQDWLQYLDKNQPEQGDWRAWVGRRFAADGRGRFNLRQAELTFVTMPARLHNISGPILFDTTRLWTPEALPVQGGDKSVNTLGTIELVFGKNLNEFLQGVPPPRPTRFSFKVTGEYLNLDEWVRPWDMTYFDQKPEKPHPLEYDPTVMPIFELRGEFATQKASYRGVLGQDFHARYDLDGHSEQANYMRWHEISAQVYGGTFKVEGKRERKQIDSTFNLDRVGLEQLAQALSSKPHVSGIYSGILTGSLRIHRDYAEPESPPVEGKGELRIEESRFVSNAVFNSLGGLLNLPLFEEIAFKTIHGPITLHGTQVGSTGMIFDNPLLNLKVSGTIGPAKKLDLKMQLQFLQIVGRIPIVGMVLEQFNKVAGKAFSVEVRGTTDNPKATLL